MTRLALTLLVALSAAAVTDVYAPRAEPLTFRTVNDFVLWFAPGADTVGEPTRYEDRERLRFRDDGGRLLVDVTIDGQDYQINNTFEIDPSGRVLAVDAVPVTELATPRVDLLPRIGLPWDGLVPGAAWDDQVARSGEEPFGPTSYSARRRWVVVGEVDAFGTRTLLAVSNGDISLRQGGFQDPEQTVRWWQEVSGSVRDSVWFDVRTRDLVANTTHMNLSGTATFESGGQGATLPSGLRSSIRRVRAENPPR